MYTEEGVGGVCREGSGRAYRGSERRKVIKYVLHTYIPNMRIRNFGQGMTKLPSCTRGPRKLM